MSKGNGNTLFASEWVCVQGGKTPRDKNGYIFNEKGEA